MKSILRLLLGIICLTIFANCAKDEENLSGNISGLVTDYTNANSPIAGATVTLQTKGLSKTTGSDGRFEFSGIEPGTYTLQVAANNYQTTTKQVTVYAGQSANCDIQIRKGSVSVDIDPITLTFGGNTEQHSFTISNNSTRNLNYSISNIPDFVRVSPTTGSVAANGRQAIIVTVLNRTSITTSRNGQMTINIGNDSYTVSVIVEPYSPEAVSINITPQNLVFDKNTEQLTFTMKSDYSQDLQYNISSSLNILTVTPTNGSLAAHGQVVVGVTVNNRKEVTSNRTGTLTIKVGSNTYLVNVSIEKYEEGGQPVETEVTNGLYAYFTFENTTKDMTETELQGTGIGTSYTDSYNGTKALLVPANSSSMLSISNGLVDQKKMSISFWAKDLSDGHIFHAIRSYQNSNCFLLGVVDGRLKFVVTRTFINGRYSSIPSFIHGSLSGWHMITLVSDFNSTTYSTITTRLYIDGVLADTITEDDNPFSEAESGQGQHYNACNKFVLGGEFNETYTKLPATKLIIDNLRVYRYRNLSEEEIKTIYQAEKR